MVHLSIYLRKRVCSFHYVLLSLNQLSFIYSESRREVSLKKKRDFFLSKTFIFRQFYGLLHFMCLLDVISKKYANFQKLKIYIRIKIRKSNELNLLVQLP